MRATVRTVLALALLGGGCGGPTGEGTGASSSPEGAWQLVSGHGADGPLRPLDRAPVRELEGHGRVGGTSACNSYSGSVRIDGDRFEVEELGATEIACEPGVAELEAAYLAALRRVDRIRRTGDTLLLTGTDVELAFEPVPPVPQEELVDTTWELDTLLDGEVASTPAADGRLLLHEDGRVEGHTGCRAFAGRYVVAAGQVRVTRLAMDDAEEPCSSALVAQDDVVVEVLGDGFRAAVDGERLTLTAGDRALVYRAR